MLGFVWAFLRPSMVIYHNNKRKNYRISPFSYSNFLYITDLLFQAADYTTNKRKRAAR
ncbi:hypothetical protein [Helicobacter pylori]|uniref:hypothetical protein n=1 Tax=Helicobacter pylori TaxID=210 RepID=UPI0013CDF99F|nr:hypothetical protein [Helicobacter pylori]